MVAVKSSHVLLSVLALSVGYICFNNKHWVTVYQGKEAAVGVYRLFTLPQEDIDKCVEAYEYLQAGTSELDGKITDSKVETEHVRRYYKVLQPLLAIADIEKMYIPPMIDSKQGLFGNQLLHEKQVIARLNVGPESHILDIGCGAGE
jgi:sterol 24-C-methyltransferase